MDRPSRTRRPLPLPPVSEQGRSTQGESNSLTPSTSSSRNESRRYQGEEITSYNFNDFQNPYGQQIHSRFGATNDYPMADGTQHYSSGESISFTPYSQQDTFERQHFRGDQATTSTAPFTSTLYRSETVPLSQQPFSPVSADHLVHASPNLALSHRIAQPLESHPHSASPSDGSPAPAYGADQPWNFRPSPSTFLPRSTSLSLSDSRSPSLGAIRIKREEAEVVLSQAQAQTNTISELPNFSMDYTIKIQELDNQIDRLEKTKDEQQREWQYRTDVKELAGEYRLLGTQIQNLERNRKELQRFPMPPNATELIAKLDEDIQKRTNQQKNLWRNDPRFSGVPHALKAKEENINNNEERARQKLNQTNSDLVVLYEEKRKLQNSLDVLASGYSAQTRHRASRR